MFKSKSETSIFDNTFSRFHAKIEKNMFSFSNLYLLFIVASLNCLSVGYTAVGCAVVRPRHSGGRQRLRHGLLKLRSLYKLHDNIPSNVLKAFPRVIHDYERKTTLTLHITKGGSSAGAPGARPPV